MRVVNVVAERGFDPALPVLIVPRGETRFLRSESYGGENARITGPATIAVMKRGVKRARLKVWVDQGGSCNKL